MDEKQVLQAYREEVSGLRWKVSQLEVNSVEQRASDEVRKWREKFDTSSSSQVERVLNEMEKRKQAQVSQLTSELRNELDQFKETNLARLAKLDSLISNLNVDDEIQFDFVNFELDSITEQLESLYIDIDVNVIDNSKRRRLSTTISRNSLELSKVFEFRNPEQSNAEPVESYLDWFINFVIRASTAGAKYYNIGILGPNRYF